MGVVKGRMAIGDCCEGEVGVGSVVLLLMVAAAKAGKKRANDKNMRLERECRIVAEAVWARSSRERAVVLRCALEQRNESERDSAGLVDFRSRSEDCAGSGFCLETLGVEIQCV